MIVIEPTYSARNLFLTSNFQPMLEAFFFMQSAKRLESFPSNMKSRCSTLLHFVFFPKRSEERKANRKKERKKEGGGKKERQTDRQTERETDREERALGSTGK